MTRPSDLPVLAALALPVIRRGRPLSAVLPCAKDRAELAAKVRGIALVMAEQRAARQRKDLPVAGGDVRLLALEALARRRG